MDNTEKLNNIRKLLDSRSLDLGDLLTEFLAVALLIKDLDHTLSNNGELPQQWANAQRPLNEIRQGSDFEIF